MKRIGGTTAALVLLLAAAGPGQEPARPAVDAAAGTGADARSAADLVAVWSTLEDGLARRQTDSRIVRRLVDLGDGALPAVAALLWGERPRRDPVGVPPQIDGRGRQLLEATLRAFPRDVLRAHVRELRGLSAAGAGSVRALWLLGLTGTAGDVELVLELLGDFPAHHLASPVVSQHAARTLEAVLGRDRRAVRTLARCWRRLDGAVARVLVPVLGASRRPAALALVGGELGRDAGLDPLLLDAVIRLGSLMPHHVDRTTVRNLRRLMESRDADLRSRAAACAGRIHCTELLPELIALLSDSDAAVRHTALEALRAITGRRYREDPERWSAWHAAETTWLARNRERLREALASYDERRIVEALRTIGGRRHVREEFADLFGPLLADENPAIRRLTCLTIERLGTPTPVPALIPLLEDHTEDVRLAARRTLESVTGLELGSAPAPWRHTLAPLL